MNPHFFTASFYFAFIWFRVHGSRFKGEVAASPRSMARVAAVLAFVISHTTFLAAQDDETGRTTPAEP